MATASEAAAGAGAAPVAATQVGEALVRVVDLTLAAGGRVIQKALTFDIRGGEVLAITGGSGCGKSTLLRHLIGLQTPTHGQIWYGDDALTGADAVTLARIRRSFGVMFQTGALWSSMSVLENLTLPLELYARMTPAQRRQAASQALATVDLAGKENLAPSDLSGGMRKRVALARAMMLQPRLLYLDEPAAGLDPVNTRRLNELVLRLSNERGTTVVMVTHDIPSVMRVADRMLFLDAEARTMTALDAPRALLANGPREVQAFLRGEDLHAPPDAGLPPPPPLREGMPERAGERAAAPADGGRAA